VRVSRIAQREGTTAHEIDITTGRAAVFTVGTPPWHRLGVTAADAKTSEEAIHLATIDWSVEQWPLVVRREAPSMR
jgi:hypothetical protein